MLSFGTGGTEYLRETAGTDFRPKVLPLIDQLDRMGSGSKLLGTISIAEMY